MLELSGAAAFLVTEDAAGDKKSAQHPKRGHGPRNQVGERSQPIGKPRGEGNVMQHDGEDGETAKAVDGSDSLLIVSG